MRSEVRRNDEFYMLQLNDQIVAQKITVAQSFTKKFMGLMGRRAIHDEAYIFPGTNAIHTFFMRIPIDVLYLNRQGKVVKVVTRMKPWRLGPWVREAWWVVELEADAAHGVMEGDVLQGGPWGN